MAPIMPVAEAVSVYGRKLVAATPQVDETLRALDIAKNTGKRSPATKLSLSLWGTTKVPLISRV
ncbi:MAG: hypothetical protein LBG43_06750 [Treponema sp.]|jgi:hypothetical protein|nr:hypothetical protein [Treponema sp.]